MIDKMIDKMTKAELLDRLRELEANNGMTKAELLDRIRELEVQLLSWEFRQWVKKQSAKDKKKIRALRAEVSAYRSQLETGILLVLASMLDELTPELKAGMKDLQEELEKMDKFINAIEFLGKVIGLVSRVATLAMI